MITRIFRRIIMFQRMFAFRTLKGVLYTRKSVINPNSGGLEIMSMHMEYNFLDFTCKQLRFTIFDYVTRKFLYAGTYEQLEYLTEFDVHHLRRLAEPSLNLLAFERSPFREHIGCL